MGKAWVFIQIMSICSCLLPCNIAYHGIPNEVLAPVQVGNAGCLLGGNYKAPMVIIPKKISQVWSLIIIGTEFDLFGASVANCVRCADQNWLENVIFQFHEIFEQNGSNFFFSGKPFYFTKISSIDHSSTLTLFYTIFFKGRNGLVNENTIFFKKKKAKT